MLEIKSKVICQAPQLRKPFMPRWSQKWSSPCWQWGCFSVSLSKSKCQVIIPSPCGNAKIVPAWEVSGLWSCWICARRETGTPISAVGKTGHCAQLDLSFPPCYFLFLTSKVISHSSTWFISLVLLVSDSPSLEGWIPISTCSINLKFSSQLKKTLWCDFNLALVIKDRCTAHAATVDMLSLCYWEKNDICLILIPGAPPGRVEAWLKSCSAKLVFFFVLSQPRMQTVTALEANWTKRGLWLYWTIRLCCGRGDWTRRAGPQRHTSCCGDTRLPVWVPSVWRLFFFFFSCSLIGLDGWAQGLLWRSPPVAVVWPKLTDCLPAIADLVAPSTAATAVAPFAVVSSMVSGGWRHRRRGTEPLILV